MPTHTRPIPVLSFFSGAGFLDIGFLKTRRFYIPWHNECHAPFAAAYKHGVPLVVRNTDGSRVSNPKKIENLKHAQKVMQEAFDGNRPSMFGVIGGPPCPDFSRAGKNAGGNGQNGKLTSTFVNMILGLRPDFFLIENVPGLLETKKHRVFLFRMLKKLGEHYAIDLQILDALEYGVPQTRRRVFVVGICEERIRRRDHADIFGKTDKIMDIDVSESRSSREVENDLKHLHWFCWPEPKYPGLATDYAKGAKACPKELSVGACFAKINGHPNAGDMFQAHSMKFCAVKEGDVSRKSFKRLHRRRYSPNAAYGNNEVHLHPTKPRRISVAEALALQGVPPLYSFPAEMTLTDKFKAISNGVPVPLAESIAKSLAQFINKEVKKTKWRK